MVVSISEKIKSVVLGGFGCCLVCIGSIVSFFSHFYPLFICLFSWVSNRFGKDFGEDTCDSWTQMKFGFVNVSVDDKRKWV